MKTKGKANGRLLPVLMTASVDTRHMKGAMFTAQEREGMYAETVRFYLDSICRDPRQRIVFCDNSGWDLASLRERVGRPADAVEWLSLDPNDFDISRGKCYNEMLLMMQAVERSAILREAGGFFKVTGRYPIYNLGYFVRKASKAIYADGVKWYCDAKDHPIYDWLRLGWCGHAFDVRLYGIENGFFMARLAPFLPELNEYRSGHKIDDILFREVKAIRDVPIVDRFPREPHFGGVAGHRHNGGWTWSTDHDSPLERAKRLVGNFIRIFIPWLKF